jgi:polar amino acid transport system substrate-binding protein
MYGGYYMIRTLGLMDVTIAQPSLASREMFLYLNKKHEKLVPKLATALKEMKLDGSYYAIFKQTMTPYLPSKQRTTP